MKLIVKYFFLTDILFLGGHLRFGKTYFPLVDVLYGGLSSITVVLHSGTYGNILRTIFSDM